MQPIDFTTATVQQVIARSAVCHPSLFADVMRRHATTHDEFAKITANTTSASVARGMAQALRTMADDAEWDRLCPDNLTMSEAVQAFQVACDLQVLPRHCRDAILNRSTF